MANFTEFLGHHQQLMYDRGDNFLAKIVNIDCAFDDEEYSSNQRSPYFKDVSSTETQELSASIMITFCVFNQGTVTSLTRTLQQVKQVMGRVQKRVKSPSEQCQVANWVAGLEKNY